MRRPEALRQIRELAADSGNVVFLDHAGRQMRKRGITRREVIEVLRRGQIIEGPALDPKGCWRCTMRRSAPETPTAVASICDEDLVVVTAYLD